MRTSWCPAGSAGARQAAEEAGGGHPGHAAEDRTEGDAAGKEAGGAEGDGGEEGGSALRRSVGL